MKRLLGLSLVFAMALAACGGTQSAKETTPPPADKSLYDRLGGEGAIKAVVEDFVINLAADARINQRFASTDIPGLKAKLADQICQATGGPCSYKGKPMLEAHKGMKISDDEFNALVEDLVKSLNKFKVPDKEATELVTALGGMKGEIVGQ